MINYQIHKNAFDSYINIIKERLKDDPKLSFKLALIEQKIKHTYRVVDASEDTINLLDLPMEIMDLVKVCALYHDIGRFPQASTYANYSDKVYSNNNEAYLNHGEAGAFTLFHSPDKDLFPITKYYKNVIRASVIFHVGETVPKQFNYKLNGNDINNFEYYLNQLENYTFSIADIIIGSFILSIIRDTDVYDILYAMSTKEHNVIKDYIYRSKKEYSLNYFSHLYNLSETLLLDYNNMTKKDYESSSGLKIPINDNNVHTLKVSNELVTRFKSGDVITLPELIAREDYSFILYTWWFLNQFFATSLNFKSTLKLVKDNNILDKIYANYSDLYKPLVEDMFIYTKDNLVDKPLEKTKNKLYIK